MAPNEKAATLHRPGSKLFVDGLLGFGTPAVGAVQSLTTLFPDNSWKSSTPKAKTPRKNPCCFISTATPNNNPLKNNVSAPRESNPRKSKRKPPSAAKITKCVAWAAKPNTAGLVDIS